MEDLFETSDEMKKAIRFYLSQLSGSKTQQTMDLLRIIFYHIRAVDNKEYGPNFDLPLLRQLFGTYPIRGIAEMIDGK